jgi:alcohol dehydrogenase, propanol-preferring
MPKMTAMVLEAPNTPLIEKRLERPEPAAEQLLIRILACAVCRTDLHVVDGDLTSPKLPLIPGHEIIGCVAGLGAGVSSFKLGDRIGVPWLGWTCGKCRYCRQGHENLCEEARFTGYTIDGGFAEYAVVDHRYCFPVPANYTDIEAAPLMCAGLIGYRALRMVEESQNIGIYGFGAAAHIVAQVAIYQNRKTYAFTKPGDVEAQNFALSLGAEWAGGSDDAPPNLLDAAIIFAPIGPLLPTALRAVVRGGIVVTAGIHMSDIPSFPYKLLWQERKVRSVANLTREDGVEFLEIAPNVPVKTTVHPYRLNRANAALSDLRQGCFEGAAVLLMT